MSIVGAVWVWLLALLCGAAALRWPRREAHRGSLMAWAVFGIAVQSLLWSILSWMELLSPLTVIGGAASLSLIAGVVGGPRVLRALRTPAPGDGASSGVDDSPWLRRTCWILLGLFFLMVGRLAFWPTVRYDDLVYHLGLPRQALLTGSWPAMPGFHYSFMPAGWDATYLLPLSLGGGSGPQLMNLIGLALLSWVVFRLARLGGGRAAAFAATVLLVVAPLTTSLGAFASNDLFVGLALAVAVHRLLHTRGESPAAVGLLTGAAWSAKYTSLPAAAGIGLAAAFTRKGSFSRRALAVAIIGACTLAVALPWTLRTFLSTGNPVYPAFYGIFGGIHWSAESAAQVASQVSHGGLENRGLLAFGTALFDLVFRSSRLGLGGINALLPILGLVGLLRASKVAHARALLIIAGVSYVGWCVTSLNLRYALILLVVLTPFAAASIQLLTECLNKPMIARWAHPALSIAVALVVLGPFLSAMDNHLRFYGKETSFRGDVGRDRMLTSRLHLATAGVGIAGELPPDARLLLVGEGRIALMPRPTLASSAYDTPDIARLIDGAQDVDEVNDRLGDFTHVVVNHRELERFVEHYHFSEHFTERTWSLFERWLSEGLRPSMQFGTVAVYEIPRSRAIASERGRR